MTDLTKMTSQHPSVDALSRSRLPVFFHAVSITFVIAVSFAAAGYFLDAQFNTKPLFLILFLIGSFPLTQWVLYRRLDQYAKKVYSASKSSKR